MPSESRIQITVKLPPDLHGLLSQAITEHKYTNMTNAIIKALEKELKEPVRMSQDIQDTDIEVQRLTEELQKNVSDLRVLQATFEGLQRLTEEKDKSIERLENDLNKAGQREEDLKQMHNNYMLQVQSLINARALTPPGSTPKEEKPKHESKPAREKRESRCREKEERVFDAVQDESPAIKESPDIEPEVKPEVLKEEKKGIQKVCLHCGKPFTAARSTGLYCSGACKTAYNRKKENIV